MGFSQESSFVRAYERSRTKKIQSYFFVTGDLPRASRLLLVPAMVTAVARQRSDRLEQTLVHSLQEQSTQSRSPCIDVSAWAGTIRDTVEDQEWWIICNTSLIKRGSRSAGSHRAFKLNVCTASGRFLPQTNKRAMIEACMSCSGTFHNAMCVCKKCIKN